LENLEFYGDKSSPSAIVVRAAYSSEGIEFFSPNDFSQQLGYMRRPAGYVVAPHIHNKVERMITQTQEVLVIRSGACEVNLYNEEHERTDSIRLHRGDIILLAHGGHDVRVLEDCEIVEIKQGPYAGDQDKKRFSVEE
jgi:hypothetical protein